MEIAVCRRCLTHAYLLVILFIKPSETLHEADRTHDNDKCIKSERQALLSFKLGLIDTMSVLSSWGGKDDDNCCKWRGVRCSNLTNRIVKLDLRGSNDRGNLSGTIGASLLELPHLNYLDLSSNDFHGQIPEFIGSLTNLIYLNFSNCFFVGSIPPHLGNLSKLNYLDLGWNFGFDISNGLGWLSSLSSLTHLDLINANLSNAKDWLQVIGNFSHIEVLLLQGCSLPKSTVLFSSCVNFPKSLLKLDLSFNYLGPSLSSLLCSFSNNLIYLDLSLNDLHGTIPNAFENMSSLTYLDLSSNNLHGIIHDGFKNMSSLNYVDFSRNNFSGRLPTSFGQLSNLEVLKLNHNSLEGVVFEAHFSLLTKLRVLDLSYNSLFLNPQFNWIPPFQLSQVILKSCKVGPRFPNWLRAQKELTHLVLLDANISDFIPNWFWNLIPRLILLNLSRNQIKGQLPLLSIKIVRPLEMINLSSNQLEGQIPPFLFQTKVLHLKNNKFSGITLMCEINYIVPLFFLDLYNNKLLGEIPNCWQNMPNIEFLNMNNKLSGHIPSSMSNLTHLESLCLRNNNFSGELPSWLANFKNLVVFDVGANTFSGPVPAWIGNNLSKLRVLSLQSNQFFGKLPSSICELKNIQILDLSSNLISGIIPNCLGNLNALKHYSTTIPAVRPEVFGLTPYVDPEYRIVPDHRFKYLMTVDDVVLDWKGRDHVIKASTLQILRSVDFSANQLTGIIPEQITDLIALHSLNLSKNNLTGHIPEKIGQLQALEFLDLSTNHLFGPIPSSLSQIDRLEELDVSYNNLSGKIPLGTQLQSFNASFYEGNPALCGSPLPRCSWEETFGGQPINKAGDENEDEDGSITPGLYISIAIGFIFGFCVYFVVGYLA